MESLIPIINKLQDVFNTIGTTGIQLPQIVVLGTQSSGKSSVLENIVGRSFLPRGTGIVTRTPLVLQLVHSPKEPGPHRRQEDGTLSVEDYGVFLHDSKKIFTDFEEIRKEIENETDRIAGNNKGISDRAISLKIFSPTVLNLTLVDLPGLTKVPVGDQPKDIESQIRDLVLKYIQNPNSIIMVVVTANTDMATHESLKLAKDYDPTGERTLAVVTKLDLMDAGTDATDILSGRVIPVKLGIIGVINRSQKDINDKKSITEARNDESKFLLTKYPSMADRNGTPYLCKKLNTLLMKHIQECLPELRDHVQKMITEIQDTMKMCGDVIKDKDEALLKIITQFSSAYCQTITGASANLKNKTLVGGARICNIFHEVFNGEVKTIVPLSSEQPNDILTLMHNATGPRPALFIPELAFEQLLKDQVERLERPSLRCAQLVHDEMNQMISRCGAEMDLLLKRFPLLRNKILDLVSALLNKRMVKLNSMIKTVIAMELAYINTRHPYFDKQGALVVEDESERERSCPDFNIKLPTLVKGTINIKWQNMYLSGQISKSDMKDCIILEKLVVSYFETVRTNILDLIPKAVMLLLVNFVKDKVQSELITTLYRYPNKEDLFQEAEDVSKQREDKANLLKALHQASIIINEIRDFYV